MERGRERQIHREGENQIKIKIKREKENEIDKEREGEREKENEIDKERERERENEIEKDTERFKDLGKLDFLMVVQFQAQADFQYCPNCLYKRCSIKKWSKLPQK